MVLVPVFSLVVRGVSVLLLLYRSNPLLQLDQASHVRGKVVLLAARWRRLVAAVLLVLVVHHLLDAYHGFGLTYKRHLMDMRMNKKKCQNHLINRQHPQELKINSKLKL